MKKIHIFFISCKDAVREEDIDDIVILEMFFAYVMHYGHGHPSVHKFLDSIIRQRSYLYEAILPFFKNELEFEESCVRYEEHKQDCLEIARAAVIASGILADALERYTPA